MNARTLRELIDVDETYDGILIVIATRDDLDGSTVDYTYELDEELGDTEMSSLEDEQHWSSDNQCCNYESKWTNRNGVEIKIYY